MELKRQIGIRFKSVRVQKKLSQDQVAKVSGFDRSYISHVENGKLNISIETLERLVESIGMSIYDFFIMDCKYRNLKRGS